MINDDELMSNSYVIDKQQLTVTNNSEQGIVMPAGAFKFLKSDIRQKGFEAKTPNDGWSCPQGPLNFKKMTSGKNALGQKPGTTDCHARRGL